MLQGARITAMLPTTQPDAARAFFRDVMGLSLVSEDQFAVVFYCHGVTLRVQKVETLTPQPFSVLGFAVEDVRASAAALAGKGVRFERFEGMAQDELGVWTPPGAAPGGGVAWFKDPDGNLLSISRG